jgi:thiamine biosynthesis lipoprotein ApbE
MEDIFDSELSAEKKAEIVQECDKYLKAIDSIFKQMEKDEQDIERLNAETRAMLNQMREAA